MVRSTRRALLPATLPSLPATPRPLRTFTERWRENSGRSLSNPYPGGILAPSGNANGYLTGVGSSVTTWYQGSKSPIVHQYSFDIQRELPGQIGSRSVTWLSLKTPMPGNGMNTANINQLPDQYLALGLGATDQLAAKVNNPYYGKGGTGVIGSQQVVL